MQFLGRALQIVGLVVLPLAMLLQLTDGLGRSFGVSQMVVMLIFGAAVFYLGRFVEGYAKRQ